VQRPSATPSPPGERLRIAFLACYGLAAGFQLASVFTAGALATVCGLLAILFVTLGFLFVAAWMLDRSGR